MKTENLHCNDNDTEFHLTKEEKTVLLRNVIVVCLSSLLMVCGFFLLSIFYKPTLTSGNSMEPTLYNGDRALVMLHNYAPKLGDIVVINDVHAADKYIVKRIIGLEGDVIDINFDTGEVTRNGVLLYEDYITEPTTTSGDVSFPITVPQGSAFVLGDNRNNSTDSRTTYTGMILTENILGEICFRFYPFDRIGFVE